MNRNIKKNAARTQITRRIVLQYFLALISFCGIFALTLLFAWQLYSRMSLSEYNILYRLAQLVKEYVIVFLGLPLLFVWAGITYFFMAKPLRYLDEVVAASVQLASPAESPIVLPDAMKQVQDRLNGIREQALKNARLAKEAEQRKNDLIVYLAHDLKTPLTSVIGYLNLLQDEPQISPMLRAKYTGIALEKAERLEELINEFFDITRFNLTTLELEPERIDLSRMLEQITSEFTPILAEKGLSWNTVIPAHMEILCDPGKLERVLDNLIRNAVSYSAPNSELFFSMRSTQSHVELTLRNHGKTIPPDKLSRIFEQFYRVDASRSSQTGGAGLGLAIAKEIVEQHGGAILAQSENESITFQVVLPTDCKKIL